MREFFHVIFDFCDELYPIYKEALEKSFSDISLIAKEFFLDVFEQCSLLQRLPVIHASSREYKIQDFSFIVDYQVQLEAKEPTQRTLVK